MQWRRRGLLMVALSLPWGWAKAKQGDAKNVVSVGGSVTEIVFALGQGDRLIAVDLSSVYPPEARALPKVGYYRDLSVEGVASLHPGLVIASDQSGPPQALQRLRDLGVNILVVPDAPEVSALRERILKIAQALSVPQAGEQMVANMDEALGKLPALPDGDQWPTALSVMAHGNSVLVAGAGTAADAIMQLSGVRNVIQGQKGYKPISAEAAAALAPDFIITTPLSIQAQGGEERFLALTSLAGTPAAKARRLVVMDDLMYLSFGPRLAEAVTKLREQCHRYDQSS
ncbi:ABC transporter substrate-binding protein [Pusillimonas sp. CC-YST705]|uniref:ABC transporter substrate-binding protein n=1 Tax=Mesopusillimonas faecipullorum TaxID=2755040 RepID=A0ABS8CBC3_9BURK|nr:ABC transporter substrate-binding protein [Mesopusillimonas faecipullorum]MCB5363330.1 ABC transporter substrate-binding protein [Mesopusillimonas faecipullorum]